VIIAVLLIAFHETIIGEKKKISGYASLKGALMNLSGRIEWGRKATAPEERRTNIDAIKGIISPHFVKRKSGKSIYANHSAVDIEAVIRRSEIELANYELKQGLLSLDEKRNPNKKLIAEVVQTIAAIANIGPQTDGEILIGVTGPIYDCDPAPDMVDRA